MSTARKIWRVLTPEQRRAMAGLLGMMLIAMVLETMSTGTIIPVLALMTQDDLATKYPAIVPVLRRLGDPSREQLVVGAALVLVALYTVKTLFLGALAWVQSRLVAGVQASMSERLFAGYLRQPFSFHLRRNSVQSFTYVGNVSAVTGVTTVGLNLIAETMVLLGISTLLLMVEPVGALLVVSLLGLAGWAFHRLTRRQILRWGEARLFNDMRSTQHLQQGLGGAKDVKLLGREDDFLAQYRFHTLASARAAQLQATLTALPRLFLELLAVVGLASLIMVMVGRHRPLESLIPIVGLFAATAFRFMPSLNRVIGAVQGVRYLLPVVDAVTEEVRVLGDPPPPERGKPMAFRKSLTLDHVSFQYESAETSALRDVSLTIGRGTVVGFIGRSGAGKSTLVDVMLGLLAPESGAVMVDGVDIQTNMRGWQDQLGYVPQSIYLTDDTLRRNVAFGLAADRIDEAAVLRAVHAAQLDEFVAELPEGLDSVVGERGIRLSGGQRQRIGIARALYHDPQVLVLDEATSALDTATEHGVMEAVRALRGDKTIIIIAHRHSTVENCDRLFRLDQGRVVEQGESAVVLGRKVTSIA